MSQDLFSKIRSQMEEFYSNHDNSNVYIRQIKDLMVREDDFDLNLYREQYLKGRIYHRVKYLRLNTFKEYASLLQQNANERIKLKELLTVHTTDFFRDVTPFRYIEKILLPKIAREKGNTSTPIRILSAPCSTGQEVYSLAIIAHYLRSKHIILNPIEIVGIDVDRGSIEKARNAIYRVDEIKNITADSIQNNFEYVNPANLRIKQEIKNCCKFVIHDMFKPYQTNEKFDLILCRNLLIYISRTDQLQIISNLLHNARKGTYFMLGMTEGMSLMNESDFKMESMEEHIYQFIKTTDIDKSYTPNSSKTPIYNRTGSSLNQTPTQSVVIPTPPRSSSIATSSSPTSSASISATSSLSPTSTPIISAPSSSSPTPSPSTSVPSSLTPTATISTSNISLSASTDSSPKPTLSPTSISPSQIPNSLKIVNSAQDLDSISSQAPQVKPILLNSKKTKLGISFIPESSNSSNIAETTNDPTKESKEIPSEQNFIRSISIIDNLSKNRDDEISNLVEKARSVADNVESPQSSNQNQLDGAESIASFEGIQDPAEINRIMDVLKARDSEFDQIVKMAKHVSKQENNRSEKVQLNSNDSIDSSLTVSLGDDLDIDDLSLYMFSDDSIQLVNSTKDTILNNEIASKKPKNTNKQTDIKNSNKAFDILKAREQAQSDHISDLIQKAKSGKIENEPDINDSTVPNENQINCLNENLEKPIKSAKTKKSSNSKKKSTKKT